MADALISPAVGTAMWTATAVTTVYCAKKVREDPDEAKIPLMGVAGAFIFAAQMLNFTIPGTGSSGHLGGGLILAILLGPEAAFLAMASVLGVQALFFGDGGLLALGANIFNLGFFPAFVAYPLYKKIAGESATSGRILTASIVSAIVGLELGALAVVVETTLSGVSELPFLAFSALVLPIHLAIGLVEGIVTAGVVLFVRQAQPELLARNAANASLKGVNLRPLLIGLAVAALVAGAALSWFASSDPDGLEWSIAKVTGSADIQGESGVVHDALAALQERTALLPGYGFRTDDPSAEATGDAAAGQPGADAGTGTAGVVGAVLVLAVAAGIGALVSKRASRRNAGRT